LFDFLISFMHVWKYSGSGRGCGVENDATSYLGLQEERAKILVEVEQRECERLMGVVDAGSVCRHKVA
jgi:hypothetical protein